MWRFVLALLIGCNGGEDPSDKPEDQDPIDEDLDQDDDGFLADDDCDDALSSVYPGAEERPYDGIDQDCADGDLVDVDVDGFDAIEAGGDDCDDQDAAIHPGVEEVPYDDIDQDCSGTDLVDVDGDGSGSDDCDDTDPTIHPDATETYYDGIDQNCRGDCDYDADHDNGVPAEWQDAVTDGSACDHDPGAEIRVLPDCNDEDASATTQQVEGFDPPDGAVGVDAMFEIHVYLRDNEPTTVIRLLDETGAEAPAFGFPVAPDEFVVMAYDPVSGSAPYPLAGFTTYTIEVSHSCGVETSTFTTGEGVGPVDPADFVGTTWDLYANGLSYPNWAALNYFGFANFGLVMLEDSDGATVDLLVAAPDVNGAQDLCVPTGEIQGVDFAANPSFTAAPFDYPVTYLDAAGTLVFPHQAGTIQATLFRGELLGVTLIGFVETQEVAQKAGIGLNQPCNMWGCVACPDGSGATCIEETYWLGGTMRQSAETIVRRTEADIAVDPACP